MRRVDDILQDISAGRVQPVYLVSGDLVLAEPAASRLASALAEKAGCELERYRRPPRLADILTDLNTYSLFSTAKVALVLDSAIVADRRAAADLIDQAAAALPVELPPAGEEASLGKAQREAASRLFQALHVFGIDIAKTEPEAALATLPEWAFQGGQSYRKGRPRGRAKKAAAELREGLVSLLELALRAGMQGFAEGDLAELGAILKKGLPEGHALVLAESSVAKDHPLVASLDAAGAVSDVGRVEVGRGGEWQGLSALADQLAEETGARIARDALAELARRTLRQKGEYSHRSVEADSTARFAAEYRKLATMAAGGTITKAWVEQTIEDRGEEDVWQILDAIGKGRGDEALSRYRRLMSSADDPLATRLSFFALLAGFCRQLTAIGGMMQTARIPGRIRQYNQFKSRWVGALQADLPYGAKNPLAGLHPFRLYRAYLAASSVAPAELRQIPWWVLETETRIKGDSSEADAAVAQLIVRLTSLARP